MVLSRIGVLSAAKMLGVMYTLFGLIFGAFFSLLSVLGAAVNSGGPNAPGIPFPFIGIGAIVILPIMYGLMGFIGGAIAAAIYNVLAGLTGGIEMDFQRRAQPEALAAEIR